MRSSFNKQTLVILLCLLTSGGYAAEQDTSQGEGEYRDSCAACHGVEGRGDGPLAKELRSAPTDLTRLSQSHGGAFPYWLVYVTIDGRHLVEGHGDRDMPIWGRQFLEVEQKARGQRGGERATVDRITELADYIQSLQQSD